MAVSRERAKKTQRRIFRVASKALKHLEEELDSGMYRFGPSHDWCARLKLVADQLRRDWPKNLPEDQDEADRGTSGGSSEPPPDDPLRGLKLLKTG